MIEVSNAYVIQVKKILQNSKEIKLLINISHASGHLRTCLRQKHIFKAAKYRDPIISCFSLGKKREFDFIKTFWWREYSILVLFCSNEIQYQSLNFPIGSYYYILYSSRQICMISLNNTMILCNYILKYKVFIKITF